MTDLQEKAMRMALEILETDQSQLHWQAVRTLRQALAQPEQEPVAWVYNGILHEFDPSEFATSEVKPLYSAPPKREWVDLDEEEQKECWDEGGSQWAIYQNIASKLKERNG